MQKRGLFWLLGASLALLCAGGMGLWLLIQEPWKPQVRLSDGSRVIVDDVTFGTNLGPPPIPLAEQFRLWTSPSLRRRSGHRWRLKEPMVAICTRRVGGPAGFRNDAEAHILNADGGACGEDHIWDGFPVSGMVIARNFPRRAPTLTLRVRDPRRGQHDLRIPNPAYRTDFPHWEAPPYPVVTRSGKIAVRIPGPPVQMPYGTGSSRRTRMYCLPLQLLEAGRESSHWGIVSAKMFDATGNHREPSARQVPLFPMHLPTFDMDRRESAWKVVLHAGRRDTHPAGPDRVFTTDWVRVPSRNEVRTLDIGFADPHFRLQLRALRVPGTARWSGIPNARTFGRGYLRTEITAAEPGHLLVRLLKVTDEQGRDLLHLPGAARLPDRLQPVWRSYPLVQRGQQSHVPHVLPHLHGARRVRFTLGVNWSRRFEFSVRPGGPNGAIQQPSGSPTPSPR